MWLPTEGPEAVSGLAKASRALYRLGNVFGLRTLRALRHLKLDFLTLFKRLEAIAFNSAIVNKDVR